MRFTSNGIGPVIDFAIRGSFMTFALTRSRALRDLKTIQEKTVYLTRSGRDAERHFAAHGSKPSRDASSA
jgi:hypothetical protein